MLNHHFEDTRLVIPSFKDKFCPTFQERLHHTINHFFELDNQFSLIINILDRSDEKILKDRRLIYGGITEQVKLLENNFKRECSPGITTTLKKLVKFDFPAAAGIEGGNLYDEYERGQLDIKDVKEGFLKDYFATYISTGEFKHDTQKFEFPILDHYFNIAHDKYLTIPLIQFANFDGLVHIIFKPSLSKIISNTDNWKKLTKMISLEYESLLLNYDVVGENMYKKSLLKEQLNKLETEEYYNKLNTNPIFLELNYQNYYKTNKKYFLERLNQSDAIPEELLKQHRKNAIMSILIDSYAHNMSAHSLTALEWWFRLRAEKLYDDEFSQNVVEEAISEYPQIPIINSPKPLAGEIHPLLRFLLDKGAFWTGLTRKGRFGGKISSLYSALWYDFIQNPLYLGTIAFSEGILQLNINLTIYESREFLEHGIKYKKKIKKSKKGRLLDGKFVQIDLSQFYDVNYKSSPKEKNESRFVAKSDLFEDFKKELKLFKIFFPGGVVGRHSFFTILENEIRNVKHFDKEHIEDMKKNGLTLNLSIEETTYKRNEEIPKGYNFEMFKIGVWLKHPVSLTQKLVTEKLIRLEKDIIDENYVPKLGGSYQDKVCAAMLLNNEFISVQNKTTTRDKQYYPWMKTGSSKLSEEKEGIIEDYELSLRRLKPNSYKMLHLGKDYNETLYTEFQQASKRFKELYQPHEGYLKKFFHLWKGENIYYFDNTKIFSELWENLSRFRFISINKKDRKSKDIRNSGAIRLINQRTDDVVTAYQEWLPKWLNIKDGYQIKFKVRNQNASRLVFDGKRVIYLNKGELDNLDSEKNRLYNNFSSQQTINLIHSTREDVEEFGNICKYRNHGIFKEYFCSRQPPEDAIIEENDGLVGELLETLATNVCIFDNRIANRVQKSDNHTLKKALKCAIYKEDTDKWKEEKEKGFEHLQFLVIHLSFIEAFKDKAGQKKYSEKEIDAFIEEEILQGKKKLNDNFKLVITTGRGRTQWWTKLEESNPNYTLFTTFRPVESLIASVENSVSMQDDIELKYRLVKVLFGS